MDIEGCAAKDKAFLETPQYNELGILSGFWERLISLMDVSGAAIALIDELYRVSREAWQNEEE